MTPTSRDRGSRRLLAVSLTSLALVVPLSACGSSSTSSSAASTAQSTTTSTPMASSSDSPSMDMTPSDSASTGDSATSSDSASASSTSTSDSSASSDSSAPSDSTASAAAPTSGKAGAFTGKKDAKVPATVVPIKALTMKTIVFPKTLGGMPILGPVSEGTANRYAGYSDPNGSDTVTATTSINGAATDVDDQVSQFFQNVNSYDGGRFKCGTNTMGSSQACVVRIAGLGQITVSTTSKLSNDQMAKFTAEFLNAQK